MKVVLNGYGRMGKMLEERLRLHPDIEIAAICDPAEGLSKLSGIEDDFDVLIDFSVPDAIYEISEYCKKPVVLAVTGYSDEQERLIIKLSDKVPVFRSNNLSLGINLMEKLVKTAAKALEWDVEIIEKHHNKKKDSPSGTAVMLAEAVRENIPIHSVRSGSIVGEHTMIFAGEDEMLEIKHTALSKKIFADGAIKAAHFITNAPRGLYNINDIL